MLMSQRTDDEESDANPNPPDILGGDEGGGLLGMASDVPADPIR